MRIIPNLWESVNNTQHGIGSLSQVSLLIHHRLPRRRLHALGLTTIDHTHVRSFRRHHQPSIISNPFHLAHVISNKKSFIPAILDIKNHNYQKWSHFFTITAGIFSLTDLLNGYPCPPQISVDDWQHGDYLLQISNTLIAHFVVKKLISVRQLTKDDSLSVEFDPFGFPMKDLRIQAVILHCNSYGDLYPFTTFISSSSLSPTRALSVSSAASSASSSRFLWHRRLGHPGDHALSALVSRSLISFSKTLS